MQTTTLMDRLQRLLGMEAGEDETIGGGEPHAVERHTPENEAEVDADFESRLCRILETNPAPAAGRIYCIDLGQVGKARPDGGGIAGRMSSIAPRVFQKHLSQEDIYRRYGPSSYLVVFAGRSEAAATLVCQRVADDIAGYFEGQESAVSIKAVAGIADSRLLLQEISQLDDPRQPVGVRPAPSDPASPTREGRAKGDVGWRNFRHDSLTTDSWSDEAGLQAQVPDAPQVADFTYLPIWDLRSKLLSTYACLACDEVVAEALVTGFPLSTAAKAEQDLRKAVHAFELLDDLVRNLFQLFLSTTVHADTLMDPSTRRSYLSVVRDVPERLRRFLAFEIIDVPAGIPSSRLAEFAAFLKPFSGAVLVEVDPELNLVKKCAGIGIHAVGIRLSRSCRRDGGVLQRIERLAVAAEECKLWTYTYGAQSSSEVIAAAAAGIRYVSGDRVKAVSSIPMHVRSYTFNDYYAEIT